MSRPAQQLHPTLVPPPRSGGLLPFSLEPTVHERPAAAASLLSGLDSHGGRRAAYAISNRPTKPLSAAAGLFAAEPPPAHTRRALHTHLAARAANPDYGEDYGDSDDEDSEYGGAAAGTSYGGYLYGDDEYDDITDSTCAAPANPSPRVVTDIPQQPQHSVSFAPGSSIPPPLPQPYSQQQQLLQEGAALVPPGQEVSAANSPRSPRTPRLSPRSLALHTPRAKKEAKRRWKLVKKNLYRLVQEEREKLGVTVVGGGGGGKRFSSQMWSVATEDWEERSVENALRSFTPLQPLTEMELRVLLQYSSLTTIARYAKVHQKGLPLTQCFLVLQGSLRLTGGRMGPGSGSRVLSAGDFCGGGAWLPGQALHPDTATALVPCILVVIRASEAKGNERLKDLCQRCAMSLGDPWKVEMLKNYVPFFCDLPLRSLRELSPLLSAKLFEPGDEIIKEGDPGDCVYVLVQGEVRVYKKRGDSLLSVIELATISDQSEFTYFGELALFTRQPRTASIQAKERSLLFCLDSADFEMFTELVPDFGKRAKLLHEQHKAKMAVATGHKASAVTSVTASEDGSFKRAPVQVAAADDDWEDELAQAPPASELPPADSLGLSDWMNTLERTMPKPEICGIPPDQLKRGMSKGVITVKANQFGLFGGLSGKAKSVGPARERTNLLQQAAAAAEAARAAMLADPPRYGFGTSS